MKKTLALTLAAGLTVSLASCGSEGSTSAIEVDNCGDTVPLDGPPENVTLLKSASVPTLQHLGVLDRVKNRAGKYPTAYYDDATNDALAATPSLTDKTDASGHLQISREEVVATGPDLVLGETDTVNRQTLASSDVPLIEEPALCGSLEGAVTWDDVWDQIRLYGTVFDRGAEADAYVTALQDRLASIEDAAT
ncbi:ABC transporter substrate-binding protein, partial [Corynebacterium variabile]|uniref:ABC transporter substrate-binding protein n=1 Tax=Corynebacterium variabile TaxID=1727 RepID=UPI0026494B7B